MSVRKTGIACAAMLLLAAAPIGHAGTFGSGPVASVSMELISSPPQYVSGGDARFAVRAAPGLRKNLEFWVNGRPVDAAPMPTEDGFEAVVTGFVNGSNTVELRVNGRAVMARMQVTNYPISGPMFSGPQQQPFVCTTTQSGVGVQPVVESAVPPGTRVFNAAGNIVGYSQNCAIETFVTYWYRSTANTWKLLPADRSAPADMQRLLLPTGARWTSWCARSAARSTVFSTASRCWRRVMMIPRGPI